MPNDGLFGFLRKLWKYRRFKVKHSYFALHTHNRAHLVSLKSVDLSEPELSNNPIFFPETLDFSTSFV